MAARGETQANVEVSTLVVPAWRLRWRAPELALVLGERALALASARHDESDRLRAESLVVFAGNRVGRGVHVAERAIDALKAAEAAGEHETAWLLRVELAACARSVGAPLTGFAAVTPVLEAPDVPAELRASALVQASECLVTVGRGDEPTRALAEADQLYVADTTLDDDTRLLLRGLIRAVQAAQHRRWGDIAAAIGAAREGLDLLSRFADPSADSGQGLGRLTLELVLALMDANRLLDASEAGAPVLDRPVRAPSASTTGWLRLALATRVHLPAGRVGLAREMLREAAASAERHQLDTLLAESLLALAHVHEVSGELADALTDLRSAHAAERRRARAVYAVRARLAAEFAGIHRQPADLHRQLAELLRPVEGMPVAADGVLSAALKQQLRQWRPVQVRKGEGVKANRVRRAAEDMTVDGLSAARQHAADRWRMVQPFGEPEDKIPEPVEPPPAPSSSSDRTVPASGLIASAGAMVSGRRRAAREAAGEFDDRPTTIAEIPPIPADEPATAQPEPAARQQPPARPEISAQPQPPAQPELPAQPKPPAQPEPARRPDLPAQPGPPPQSGLTPEQERKRKVEQQLMELQREARRQIEAERQARADQRAQAEREAREAEETTRQEAARQEAARQEAARQEAARKEAARAEAARKEAARREAARLEAVRRDVARQEAAHQEVARQAAEREEAAREAAVREEAARADAAARGEAPAAQPESVLDMLKAQGLRAGGRRRARDAEAEPATPSWRVEPPAHHRQDDPGTGPQSARSYSADAAASDTAGAEPQGHSASPRQDSSGAEPQSSQSYFGASAAQAAPDARSRSSQGFSSDDRSASPDHPNYFADPDMPDRSARSGLAAAFSRPPAVPGFGPHPDEPGHPLHTPAAGFPTAADPDERKLPDLDFSSLDFTPSKSQPSSSIPTPEPVTLPEPEPSPAPEPLPPVPDPVPTVPIPDEIPRTPEPDLLSSTFLSSADVEDDASDVPTVPVRAPRVPDERPSARTTGEPPAFGSQSGFGAQSSFGTQSFGDQSFGNQSFGSQGSGAQGFGTQSFGAQSSFGSQSGVEAQPGRAIPSDPETAAGGATHADPAAQAGSAEPDHTASAGLAATGGEPARTEADGETGGRTGRPSSRRRPSDLSLADLLAEALVAYETGRRSDEEHVEATDLAAPEWTSAEPADATGSAQSESPQPGDSPFRRGEPFGSPFGSGPAVTEPAAEARSGQDSSFGTGPAADSGTGADSGFGAAAAQPAPEAQPGSDSPWGTGSAAEQRSSAWLGADSYFATGQFGGQAGAPTPYVLSEQPFVSQQPSVAPVPPPPSASRGPLHQEQAPESEEEKTGPIVPVGTAPDSETTGPIRPVSTDGPPGWTLPGT
ncbi:hypothetical protein SAMN05216188_1252 [Lentzea xinjiangensis]|uniref:Histone H1-like nucleoprotein HC2 n=1 Tax=Lentzea xinjiangensis TaxID=402600 RepID=A0A1H9V8M5_9PSEU|nr:hypothetical protein [Lentzea xinjiangensis]SES17908.1 hypothetical protein SAMN05216188_1252 [Lentzea xinjiangensis]